MSSWVGLLYVLKKESPPCADGLPDKLEFTNHFVSLYISIIRHGFH